MFSNFFNLIFIYYYFLNFAKKAQKKEGKKEFELNIFLTIIFFNSNLIIRSDRISRYSKFVQMFVPTCHW